MKTRDDSANNVARWKIIIMWALRAIILASGIYQTFFGETAIGIMILILAFLIMSPYVIFRKKNAFFPIEVEILLLAMVLLQFVIGEARDYYTNENFPYFDKFVHFMLPLFLGMIGFLIVYTMRQMGHLRAGLVTMAIIIVMATLAIGAAWEIFEYVSDEYIYPHYPYHHFQGSQTQDAIDDTMNDLIADTAGATAGAILGIIFIGRAEKRGNKRLGNLTDETATWVAPKD